MSQDDIILKALQEGVTITPRVESQGLVVVGLAGMGGREFSLGSVDVTVDAVVTSGRRMGKTLADLVPTLSGLEVISTDGFNTFGPIAGRKAHVSGLSITSLNFSFDANNNAAVSMGLIGDGVTWSLPTSPQGTDIDLEHTPALCNLFRVQYGSTDIFVSGLQSASFAATLNREPVFQLGDVLPFGAQNQVTRPVRWPPQVNVSLSAFSNHVRLRDWLEKFQTTYDPKDFRKSVTISVLEQATGDASSQWGTKNWIVVSGLVPTQATLSLATTTNTTLNLEFTGHDMEF